MKFGYGLAVAIMAGTAIAATPAEKLSEPAVTGFIVGHQGANDRVAIRELVPNGETVENWNRMITDQRIFGGAEFVPPAKLAGLIADGIRSGCPGGTTGKIAQVEIDGRPGVRMRADCPKVPSTGKPETFLLLALAGSEDVFSRQVAFRHVPNGNEIKWAEKILSSTRLCRAGRKIKGC